MQKVKSKPKRWQSVLILLLILAGVAAAVTLVITLLSHRPVTSVTDVRLPCEYNDSIKPFGSNVLYYDGESIHCINNRGAVRWSFQLGASAGFDCTDDTVVAWVGNTIYIIDRNGNSTYNDNLGESIQFARAGKQYVAAVIGDVSSPRLVVKDHLGAHMDEEADAYKNLMILNVGFYGKNGEYMWTLALDVYGTASNTILNTFEVGKMNTGEVSLGSSITYAILYENSVLRVVNTRKMLSFNYRGTEDTTASVLVYGWRLIGSEIPDKGNALMLFAPTAQTDSDYDIRELRLISGTTDRRYSLPDTCLGATVWDKNLYAVSADTLYRAAVGDNRFSEFPLPMDKAVDRFIGVLSDGHMVVACGDEVYVCTLPQTAGK
jgi:hypothetical protein